MWSLGITELCALVGHSLYQLSCLRHGLSASRQRSMYPTSWFSIVVFRRVLLEARADLTLIQSHKD